jgi:zinc transport system ATP-binding protein
MTVIEAHGLCVRYGHESALEGVELEVPAGDFLAVVGPNGSGKTTLVRAILGLVPAHSGTVLLHGLPPERATRAHPVGYLPQALSFADSRFPATVREVVGSGLVGRRMPQSNGKAAPSPEREVERVLDLLKIRSLAARRVGTLSGGQQQRTHLARALVTRPRILVLDEPTGALDPESRDCFFETLAGVNKEGGVTIVMVSHDVASVARAARTILYLDRTPRYYGPAEDWERRAGGHYFGAGHHHGRAGGPL